MNVCSRPADAAFRKSLPRAKRWQGSGDDLAIRVVWKAVAIATGGAAGGGLPDPFRVVWGRSDTPTALTVLLLERYRVT